MQEATELPTTNDSKTWRAYWKAQGLPWRTESLISALRQEELAKQLHVVPDIELGIYPLAIPLSRADLEWLLTQHDNRQGPVIWEEERAKNPSLRRDGLDLRGADLRGKDLSKLPLARTLFALRWDEWKDTTPQQQQRASALLEGASLWGANLEGIRARGVSFQGCNLAHSYLEKAQLLFTNLIATDLHGARFYETEVEGAILSDGCLPAPFVLDVSWEKTDLSVLDWSQVRLLGDENDARKAAKEKVPRTLLLKRYQKAVRAHRQLADTLKKQGLDEEGDFILYRSKVLQRAVLWIEQRRGAWFISLLQELISGYGYRPSRLLLTLVFQILLFAVLYYSFSLVVHAPLTMLVALSNSVMTLFGNQFTESAIPHTELLLKVSELQLISGFILWGLWGITGLQWLLGK